MTGSGSVKIVVAVALLAPAALARGDEAANCSWHDPNPLCQTDPDRVIGRYPVPSRGGS